MENEELKLLYELLMRYTCKIIACFRESCYAYGEIYSDIAFGALIGTIRDAKIRHDLLDMALERNVKMGEPLCGALDRRELMEKAATASLKHEPAAALFELFGMSENVQTADRIKEIAAELFEHLRNTGVSCQSLHQ